MKTAIIRQKLHNYLEAAEDKKIKALYTIVEEELGQLEVDYSEELRTELDKRLHEYKTGKVKPISADLSKKRIDKILKTSR